MFLQFLKVSLYIIEIIQIDRFNQNDYYDLFIRKALKMNVATSKFKLEMGQYMALCYQEPIILEKHGRPAAVLISYEKFKHLASIEDYYKERKKVRK